MEKKKGALLIGGISIFILTISLLVCILDIVLPIDILIHPALTMLLCLFLGFGIMSLVLGIVKKSPFYLFLSAIQLALSALYVIIALVTEYWWIGIIVAVFILLVTSIVSIMINGNKTEAIAENDCAEYKDYKQRKEEKIACEKQNEVDLPKIKSFKDGE